MLARVSRNPPTTATRGETAKVLRLASGYSQPQSDARHSTLPPMQSAGGIWKSILLPDVLASLQARTERSKATVRCTGLKGYVCQAKPIVSDVANPCPPTEYIRNWAVAYPAGNITRLKIHPMHGDNLNRIVPSGDYSNEPDYHNITS